MLQAAGTRWRDAAPAPLPRLPLAADAGGDGELPVERVEARDDLARDGAGARGSEAALPRAERAAHGGVGAQRRPRVNTAHACTSSGTRAGNAVELAGVGQT